MNFIMPQFLGEYNEFNDTVIKPIKKAFTESESSSSTSSSSSASSSNLSLKVFKSTNETQLEKNAQISAEGLSILRSLHKQVLFFSCEFFILSY